MTEKSKDLKKEILETCPCKRKQCIRYGDCDACRSYHSTKKRPVACENVKEIKTRKPHTQ